MPFWYATPVIPGALPDVGVGAHRLDSHDSQWCEGLQAPALTRETNDPRSRRRWNTPSRPRAIVAARSQLAGLASAPGPVQYRSNGQAGVGQFTGPNYRPATVEVGHQGQAGGSTAQTELVGDEERLAGPLDSCLPINYVPFGEVKKSNHIFKIFRYLPRSANTKVKPDKVKDEGSAVEQ